MEYLIALGANQSGPAGGRRATLLAALDALDKSGATISGVSRFFQTPAFPAGAGPDFVNGAARIQDVRPPGQMLALLHRIEADLGRVRDRRWGPRALDLDLLAAEGLVLPDRDEQSRWRTLVFEGKPLPAPQELILPHPRLQERAFVLVPLAEVAPDWQHPVTGLTVAEMLAAVSQAERAEVLPLG